MKKGMRLFENIQIFLLALTATFGVLACSNLNSVEKPSVVLQPGMGVVCGSVQNNNVVSRSVVPAEPSATNIEYSVVATPLDSTATASGKTSISATMTGTNFEFALPYGKWKITAKAFDKAAATPKPVLMKGSEDITLSSSAPSVQDIEIKISYATDEGNGKIELPVQFPSDKKYVKKATYSINTSPKIEQTTDNDSFTILADNVPPGAYKLEIKFYGGKNEKTLFYRIDQIVNVYSNLTTTTIEGGAPYISSGKINLTNSQIEEFLLTTIYVGGMGFGGTNANDDNTGSLFDPVATLAGAVALVNNSAINPTGGFNIIVQANISAGDDIELDAGKKLSIKTTNAGTQYKITGAQNTFTANEDLTINDLTFDKMRFVVASGDFTMENCTIEGNTVSGEGGALCINTAGTVGLTGCTISGNTATNGGGIYIANGTTTITNTTIGKTGVTSVAGSSSSNSASKGGGIYITKTGTKTEVTLDGTTYVSYNKGSYAGSCGGGIAVIDGAKLTVNKNAVIQYNSAVYGGGIYSKTALTSVTNTIELNGTIKNNQASTSGGGIHLTNTNATVGTDAKILNNNSNGESSATDGGGGGIHITTNGSLELNGGEISGNSAKSGGGAIHLRDGTLKISDSVLIPYDAVNIKNDVYVVKGKKITLGTDSVLKDANEKIAIKLSEYEAGTPVLEGDGATINQTLCDKFKLLNADGTENTTFTIKPDTSTPANGVLASAAVKISPVYLKGTGGDDNNSGDSADNAVATLAHALEILAPTADTPTIIIANAYTLKTGEEDLLNRTSSNAYTIQRYCKDSTYCTDDLITISSGPVTIKNVTIDGNWKKASGTEQITSSTGTLLKIIGATVTIEAGATLRNNRGSSSGAINSDSNSIVTIDGGTIEATTGRAILNSGELIIKGDSKITGNEGSTCGAILNRGTLTIEGGTISGNKSNNNGKIAIYTTTNITMKDGAQIADDNYVYLAAGKYITVAGALTKDTVARITLPDANYKANTQVLAGNGVEINQTLCNKFILNDPSDPIKICADYIITPDGSTPPKGVLSAPSAGPSIVILTGMTFSLTSGGTAVTDNSQIPLGSTITFTATPQILGGGTWALPAETTYRIELVQGGSVLKYNDSKSLQVFSNSALAGLVCDIRVEVIIPGYGFFDQPITGVKLVGN